MAGSSAKEIREILDEAERQGWSVDRSGRKHHQLLPPDPAFPPIHVSKTPSDHRWRDNLLTRMRRAGFVWPPPRRPPR